MPDFFFLFLNFFKCYCVRVRVCGFDFFFTKNTNNNNNTQQSLGSDTLEKQKKTSKHTINQYTQKQEFREWTSLFLIGHKKTIWVRKYILSFPQRVWTHTIEKYFICYAIWYYCMQKLTQKKNIGVNEIFTCRKKN